MVQVAILSYEHKQKTDRKRGLFFCFTYYIDLNLYKVAKQTCIRFAVAFDLRYCLTLPQTKVREVLQGEPKERNPKLLPIGDGFGFLLFFGDLS